MINVRIKRLNCSTIPMPKYATEQSAGMDIYAANLEPIKIEPGAVSMIPTSISIALPVGFEAQIRSRSGLAAQHNVIVLNSPGTIDADYRGEIGVILMNLGKEPFIVEQGTRIAQMVITRHEVVKWQEVESLDDTDRGSGGFGSTGNK
ncbi:MAG: dUTP diphosphatase [Rickettsiaceae bacterium]|nr:MAG: dUTP diphosphatase [Rickettsiaceae bacterium]